MHPHLHISGFALFLIVVFVLGFTAIILGYIASSRQAKREADIEMERVKRGASVPASGGGYRGAFGGPVGGMASPVAAAPVATYPAYVAPGYSGSDVALGMMAGAALGSAMSHHDTVIVDRGGYAPEVYIAPVDSGISYDSGPSYDSGGGGGIDISFD